MECFDLPELTGEIRGDSPLLTESTDYHEFDMVEQDIPTKENILTMPEARDCIKGKFATYHKLLDDKESELLAELELLEETNKPELNHVRSDLVRLRGVVDSLDESLDTNTLKVFLGKQKSLCEEQIQELERSELLLSHVTLDISDETFVDNLINVNPYLSKARFRTELAPLLELKSNVKEDWYIVSKEWFSEFTTSINLTDPQQNDRWEFPVEIPIQTTCDANCTKLLYSKAWDMLLAFNGLSSGSIPIKRQYYLNRTTNRIAVPIQATKHKCTVGHNAVNNKFSFECEIETFPYETYEDILKKLSVFYTRFTDHAPILYTFNYRNTILCNSPHYTQYTVGYKIKNPVFSFSRQEVAVPVQDTLSSVGVTRQLFLVIIPDSFGNNQFTVFKSSNYRN